MHDEQEVASLLRDFTVDCGNVTRSVEAARMQTAAQPAWGLADTFAEVQKAHDINVSLLDQLESNTAFTLKQFSSLKARVTKRVIEGLRRLSELETRIQALYKSMATLSQLSKSMHEAFKQLVCARNMPAAYREYEREIARRTAFGVSVADQIARCVEQLRAMCDNERTIREEFRKQYVRYLPKELQQGTASQPPVFDFVLPPFDTDIPKISDAALTTAVVPASPAALAPMVSSGPMLPGASSQMEQPSASSGSLAHLAPQGTSPSQQERETLLKDLEESRRTISELERNVSSLRETAEKVEKERAELARTALDGQRLLEASTRRSQDETAALQNQVEALRAEIAAMTDEREKSEARMRELDEAFATTEAEHTRLVAQLREQRGKADEALAHSQSVLGEHDAREAILQRQLENMQSETAMLPVLQSQLEDTRRRVQEKEEGMTRLNAERAALATELDRTKAELAEAKIAK